MNKITADLVAQLKTMIDVRKELVGLIKEHPDSKEKIDLLRNYFNYEIQRTINDVIHNERL